jgi:cellulose synthase/poly-beta-1,6-N-acetylglucosamine synthase-like glycosyltransferase
VSDGISVVVPVRNGAAWIENTLAAIVAQDDRRAIEIIAVDDRSSDDSPVILQRLAARWPLRVLSGDGAGAAAALNTGFRAARFPIVCQIDQDVVVRPDWMRRLTAELDDPTVAAAQGYFETDQRAGLCGRAMNLDLEQRYAAIAGSLTGHVCTGNTAYRASALQRIGHFDETLGYGYDNDVSYRLLAAGYRLTICREARAVHRWREGLIGYLAQQYGFGYGRIDLVAKHPSRVGGDSVSPAAMMVQPLLTALAIASAAAAAIAGIAGASWLTPATAAAALLGVVVLDRLIAGVAAARRFRTLTPLVFPLLHVARNLAWVAAIVGWTARRLAGRRSTPAHSMRPRPLIALETDRRDPHI